MRQSIGLEIATSGDLQVGRSGVEVEVEGLATNCDWAQVGRIVLLWVGIDASGLGSGGGSGNVRWGNSSNVSVLVVGLHPLDSSVLEDLAGLNLADGEGRAAHKLGGSREGESGRRQEGGRV